MASSETQHQQCLSYHQPSTGLLTTVAQLPPKYKIRYLAQTLVESPLDLSVKQSSVVNSVTVVPITPPPSPPKKRYRDEEFNNDDVMATSNTAKQIKAADFKIDMQKEVTPQKPIKVTSAPKTSKIHQNPSKEKKSKAMRKLKFDEDTTSPVSGTIIRPLEEITDNCMDQSGDIDPQYNIVEVTEEAKAELAAIKNVIGAYVCKLCRIEFEDAFGLARHRCSCIVLLEYRCPECGKRFNCPANLASHRRWHKPKDEVLKKQQETTSENEQQFACEQCGKAFKRQAYLRKHLITHKKEKGKEKSKKDADQCEKSTTTMSVTSYRTDDSNSMESSSHYSYSQSQTPYQESSHHSYFKYDSDLDYPSDSSSPGRLRIVETSLTEEENIAAAALAHLRNGPSVIQHTTAAATVAF